MAKLRECPFCGCRMNVVAHSAFHRTDSSLPASCWLATAGEFGGSYELDESDYPAWNRRPPDPAVAAVIEECAKVAEHYLDTKDYSVATAARWIAEDIRALLAKHAGKP